MSLAKLGIDWMWKLHNIAFESGVVLEDWRTAATAPLYFIEAKRRR